MSLITSRKAIYKQAVSPTEIQTKFHIKINWRILLNSKKAENIIFDVLEDSFVFKVPKKSPKN